MQHETMEMLTSKLNAVAGHWQARWASVESITTIGTGKQLQGYDRSHGRPSMLEGMRDLLFFFYLYVLTYLCLYTIEYIVYQADTQTPQVQTLVHI
jgi:hypothetical protein